MRTFKWCLIWLMAAGLAPAATSALQVARTSPAVDLVGGSNAWNEYFPFRLGDSWTYDWSSEGPMALGGTAVRTRVFEGTSFLSDTVGYKLVSDDGSFHLYTFDKGVLAIHSSLEAGRYFDYDPPVVIAAPDLRVGEPRITDQKEAGRRWTTTLLGLREATVPLGTFERALAVQVDMEGPDYLSSATYVFAPRVGLVSYRYELRESAHKKLLLGVDGRLRLARLAGVNVASRADVARVAIRETNVHEDRGVRQQLKAALERRYTWGADFKGLRGDVVLSEAGGEPMKGTFSIGADLSVRVDAPTDAARVALRNEISSFVTHRKPTDFDVTYGQTTFVEKAERADGSVVIVAAGDPLMTSYTIQDGEITEMGRSMGRVSYVAREQSKLRTDDGRSITTEYEVTYTSNEENKTLSTEHTRDTYARLDGIWVPQERHVERHEPGRPDTTRMLILSNLRTP